MFNEIRKAGISKPKESLFFSKSKTDIKEKKTSQEAERRKHKEESQSKEAPSKRSNFPRRGSIFKMKRQARGTKSQDLKTDVLRRTDCVSMDNLIKDLKKWRKIEEKPVATVLARVGPKA